MFKGGRIAFCIWWHITFYRYKVRDTEIREAGQGYELDIKVNFAKFYSDSVGALDEQELNDLVDIAVLNAEEERILMHQTRVQKGDNLITIALAEKPSAIVVDPFYKLIDLRVGRVARKVY